MSLYDYRQQASWLDDGWHDVHVKAVRVFSANTGTPGLEVKVARQDGATGAVSFYLTEKGYKRLAWFAEACGLTEQEMRAYNPESDSAHRVLVNRRVRVFSQKPPDEKYHRIEAWEPADKRPAKPVPSKPAPPTEPAQEPSDDDESIPF